MRGLILILFILATVLVKAQESVHFNPRSPVSYPIILSGSFGELRADHFHSGIDIKPSSWNKAGDPVYAAEDGFISRVSVRGGGYGNALYIDHPGGFTTVYGHLQSFSDEINNYVKEEQYAQEKFSVNLIPEKERFKIKKGARIGTMGNTGSSLAAHLHFEIRYTNSEKPLDPMLYGIGPKDQSSPVIQKIKLVRMQPDSSVVDWWEYPVNYLNKGLYRLDKDTILVNAWRVGIEVNGFDRMDGALNKNGIHRIEMYLNDQKVYGHQIDSFSFDESRHINAHINYPDFFKRKVRFQRCYRLKANPLPIYDSVKVSSIIPLFSQQAQKVKLVVTDISGNSSTLQFWLKRKQTLSESPPIAYLYQLEEGKAHLIKYEGNILYFPDTALYEKCYLNLNYLTGTGTPPASGHLFINTQNNVFKNPVDLYMNYMGIPDSLLEKAVIAECTAKNFTSYGGEVFEDFITTKIDKFGNFAIFIDTIPPVIKPINYSADMRGKKNMVFEIRDNLGTTGAARQLRYKGLIDNHWVLFVSDDKNHIIQYNMDGKLSPGYHQLRLELTDDRNNITIFETKFRL